MSTIIGMVRIKVISIKTTNFFFELKLNIIYFQPDLSNIRIASSLFEPNRFRSKSSILKSPQPRTISLGLIERCRASDGGPPTSAFHLRFGSLKKGWQKIETQTELILDKYKKTIIKLKEE